MKQAMLSRLRTVSDAWSAFRGRLWAFGRQSGVAGPDWHFWGVKLAIWGTESLIGNLGFLVTIWKGPNCRVFHRLSLFRLLCSV
jgi:hypothetical protein